MTELKTCPVCGGCASLKTDYDAGGCIWHFVGCWECGLRTRGKWVSHSSETCPIFYSEVRNEWNDRLTETNAAAQSARIKELEAHVKLLEGGHTETYLAAYHEASVKISQQKARIEDPEAYTKPFTGGLHKAYDQGALTTDREQLANKFQWHIEKSQGRWIVRNFYDGEINGQFKTAGKAFDRCNILNAEIALKALDEWQSIETAPKDGTSVLGFDGNYYHETKSRQIYKKYPHEKGGPTYENYWSYEDEYSINPWKPTHWKPIPAMPKDGISSK